VSGTICAAASARERPTAKNRDRLKSARLLPRDPRHDGIDGKPDESPRHIVIELHLPCSTNSDVDRHGVTS